MYVVYDTYIYKLLITLLTMEEQIKKRFIELSRINFQIARSGFKYKVSKKRFLLAGGFAVASLIVPDLSIGLIISLCLLSPVGLRKLLSHKKDSLVDWVRSKYYKMRLRL